MDVLVLGWSDIVRRRVLPALDGLPDVGVIHVATGAGDVSLAAASAKPGRVLTGDFRKALNEFPDALVYVSGVNTDHAERVLAALDAGHDVVVDKPAVLTNSDRDACLRAAASRGLMLAEATVWPLHSQVRELLARLQARGLRAELIESVFVIPALPESNFRTQQVLGGGAVSDMGAYAMSPARVFGSGDLATLESTITQRADSGLDLAFEVSASYTDGLALSGRFSLDGDYANRLTLSGDGWSAVLQPAFSSKPAAELTVSLIVDGVDQGFSAPPCDAFSEFLGTVVSDLATGRRSEQTERTAQSTADVLALAGAAGIEWPAGVH